MKEKNKLVKLFLDNYDKFFRRHLKKKKASNFLLDCYAESFKDKNIYEEQLKVIKPSFLKELAVRATLLLK